MRDSRSVPSRVAEAHPLLNQHLADPRAGREPVLASPAPRPAGSSPAALLRGEGSLTPAASGRLSHHPEKRTGERGITEWWGLEGTSVGHPVQPPAQAGSLRAGCTAPRPGGAGISPEKETPQPPWAAWARVPSPSEGRSSSSGSAGTSSASVCARCPLSCRWAPLERVWPHPDPPPADI